ncbi:MAG: HNH endonuclease [Actinobacteria bacterium]|nr:HNH endonuclease [Actinomycetota bacterium]
MRSEASVELLGGVTQAEQPVSTELVLVLPDQDSDESPSFDGRHITDSAADRLSCDPKIRVLVEDALGHPVGASHKKYKVPKRLRRQLVRRDQGRCQFPGCCSKRRLHAHHVIHWARGGPTKLDNLILVCSFHHHLLHEGGWSFRSDNKGGFTLHSPAGELVDRSSNHNLTMRVLPPAPKEAVLHPQNYSPLTDLSWITALVHHNAEINRTAA